MRKHSSEKLNLYFNIHTKCRIYTNQSLLILKCFGIVISVYCNHFTWTVKLQKLWGMFHLSQHDISIVDCLQRIKPCHVKTDPQHIIGCFYLFIFGSTGVLNSGHYACEAGSLLLEPCLIGYLFFKVFVLLKF
jgi:hypothetical protein